MSVCVQSLPVCHGIGSLCHKQTCVSWRCGFSIVLIAWGHQQQLTCTWYACVCGGAAAMCRRWFIHNRRVCSQSGGGFLGMSTSHNDNNRSPLALYFRFQCILIIGCDRICGSDTREEHWAAQAWLGPTLYSVFCVLDRSWLSLNLHMTCLWF